jgi:dihydrofolate reductase
MATLPMRWPSSSKQAIGTLTIFGSGDLIKSLMQADLIDEYLLMIHPLVLGTGRRMFPNGAHTSLRLTDSVTTGKGVVIATYEPARNSRRPRDDARSWS